MRRCSVLLLCLWLCGCLGTTPDRARIEAVQWVGSSEAPVLEVEQRLKLSRTMLSALSHGIDLRLVYVLSGCVEQVDAWHSQQAITLRYAALRRAYELDFGDGEIRHFQRRSALLGALDRVRLRIPAQIALNCSGEVGVALDLTRLPTPLRLPAFLRPAEWRLASPAFPWPRARA